MSELKYTSREAKEYDVQSYNETQSQIVEKKKERKDYLYDLSYAFWLDKSTERRVRFLQHIEDSIMLYEHKAFDKTSGKIYYYTCPEKSLTEPTKCAFCEAGDRPTRSFIFILYDYDHIDKPNKEGQVEFRKVKYFRRGIQDYQDRLLLKDKKVDLTKRDVIITKGDTYDYIHEDISDFLKDNPSELKKVQEVLKNKIWLKQFMPITYEQQQDELKYKVNVLLKTKKGLVTGQTNNSEPVYEDAPPF